MDLEPKIVILLSTYNGEDYLAEQLDSLLKQTYSNFIIIIRDDASNDSTEQIINHYVERNQGKIEILPKNSDDFIRGPKKYGGARKNDKYE